MKFKKLLVTLTALLLCTTMAWAQTTSAAGNWNTSGNWTGGVPASNGTVTVNHDMVVDGNITVSGTSSPYGVYTVNQDVLDAFGGTAYTLTVTNSSYNAARALFDVTSGSTRFEGAATVTHGTIRVRSGATLTIGALTLAGNSKITIDAGGTLIVNGALTDNITSASGITVNGYLQINGSYTSGSLASHGGIRVTGSGEMYTQNSINTQFGSASIFGSTNNASLTFNSGRGLACASGTTAHPSTISPGYTQLGACEFVTMTHSVSGGTVSSRQWQVSTTGPGSGFSDISGETSASYASSAGQTVNKWYRVKYQILSCSGSPFLYTYPVAQLVAVTNTWTGITSTAWNTASNWSLGVVPDIASDVVIPSGTTYSPTAPTSTINIRTLTVNSGATLTVSDLIKLNCGTGMVNNGTISGSLKVEFVGGTQSLSGSTLTTFTNLNVTNSVVTLNSDTDIITEIKLTGSSSVLDVDGSGNDKVCKLISSGDSPDVTARVAAIPSGASITGNITVQRYISAGRFYKYISTPVSGAIFSTGWQDDFAITGAFTGVSTVNPENGSATICGVTLITGTPSAFKYDETVTGIANSGYYQVPVSTNTESIESGKGYSVFLRDCTDPKIIDLTGTLTQGNVVVSITNTNGGVGASQDGWNLIGNPYASAIDWSGGGITNLISNTTGVIYTRESALDRFRVYNINTGVGANDGSKYTAMGQAVWVQANPLNGYGAFSITFTESAKASVPSNENFGFVSIQSGNPIMYASLNSDVIYDIPTTVTDNILRMTLSNPSNPNNLEETVVHFDASASSGYDQFFDAKCFDGRTNSTPIAFGISSSFSGVEYTIKALPTSTMISSNYSLNTFAPAASTALTLDFSGMDTFADNVGLKLIDNVTSTTTSIDEFNPTYAFTSVSDQSTPRFTLDFVTKHTVTGHAAATVRAGSGSYVIYGTGFSTTLSDQTVKFWNGSTYVNGTVTAATSTQLTVTVPGDAKPGYVRVVKDGFTKVHPVQITPTYALELQIKNESYPVTTANYYYRVNGGSWVHLTNAINTTCQTTDIFDLPYNGLFELAVEHGTTSEPIEYYGGVGIYCPSSGTVYGGNRAGACGPGRLSQTITGYTYLATTVKVSASNFTTCTPPSLEVEYKCSSAAAAKAYIYYKVNSGSWTYGGATSNTDCRDFTISNLSVGDVVYFATEDDATNSIAMYNTGTCGGSLGSLYSENRAGTCSTGHYSKTITSGVNTTAIRIQIGIGGLFFSCL